MMDKPHEEEHPAVKYFVGKLKKAKGSPYRVFRRRKSKLLGRMVDEMASSKWKRTKVGYSHYAKYDMRILKPGEGGNCAAISFTKFPQLVQAGYSPVVKTCRLESGEEHLYLVVDGWALDNRYSMPVKEWQVGCE